MKLVEKMILLAQMLRENEKYTLDIESSLKAQLDYFLNQKNMFKDDLLHSELIDTTEKILALKNRNDELLEQIHGRTKGLLRDEELKIFRRDYNLYQEHKPNYQLMIERSEHLDEELLQAVKQEVGNISRWEYAGIELNPSNGIFTRSMLSCDPLYLYTGNVTDMDAVRNRFNEFFREKRLFCYSNFKDFPQDQMGVAVSVNCYEFWPLDPIKDEMKHVFNLLRPGGMFVFTYNDCETEASLDLCANNYRSYNTKELMSKMVEMLGFDIVRTECIRKAHSFMVVKKPGERTTQKLSAPLVTINQQF